MNYPTLANNGLGWGTRKMFVGKMVVGWEGTEFLRTTIGGIYGKRIGDILGTGGGHAIGLLGRLEADASLRRAALE